MVERTLCIIKPDAVRKGNIGKVNTYIEGCGLRIIACKMFLMSSVQASEFYSEHKTRPFFKSLVEYMTSGSIVLQVLEGDNAVSVYRKVMGVTDPRDAAVGTIRRDLADSIEENCVHGSDSISSAQREISFFFSVADLLY